MKEIKFGYKPKSGAVIVMRESDGLLFNNVIEFANHYGLNIQEMSDAIIKNTKVKDGTPFVYEEDTKMSAEWDSKETANVNAAAEKTYYAIVNGKDKTLDIKELNEPYSYTVMAYGIETLEEAISRKKDIAREWGLDKELYIISYNGKAGMWGNPPPHRGTNLKVEASEQSKENIKVSKMKKNYVMYNPSEDGYLALGSHIQKEQIYTTPKVTSAGRFDKWQADILVKDLNKLMDKLGHNANWEIKEITPTDLGLSEDVKASKKIRASISDEEYAKLFGIASENMYGLKERGDLERRWSDGDDFIEVSVWGLKDALIGAYKLGQGKTRAGREVKVMKRKASARKTQTTGKDALKAIRKEIREFLEMMNDGDAPTKAQVQDILDWTQDENTTSNYQKALRHVEAGNFRVYDAEIEKWLLENNLSTQAQIDKGNSFDFYKRIIARELSKFEQWWDSSVYANKVNASQSAEDVAYYFTQYANYQDDESALEWMTPLFEKILAEVDVDFGNIDDGINQIIYENLNTIAENPEMISFLEDSGWENSIVVDYLSEEDTDIIPGTYEDFLDMLGVDKNIEDNIYLLEAIYDDIPYNGDGFYELNGYANGFDEVDLDDYMQEAIDNGNVETEEEWEELDDYEKLDIVREWGYDVDSASGLWEYFNTFGDNVEKSVVGYRDFRDETAHFSADEMIYLNNGTGSYYSEEDIIDAYLEKAFRHKIENY